MGMGWDFDRSMLDLCKRSLLDLCKRSLIYLFCERWRESSVVHEVSTPESNEACQDPLGQNAIEGSE